MWGEINSKAITRKEIRENLLNPITVRGPYGEEKIASEVIIAYERKKKFLNATGNQKLNINQQRILKSARKKGIITISATIQEKGDFIEVDREFLVKKRKKNKGVIVKDEI